MVIDLSGLNEPQKQAVMHNEGPLLVVAGAGSGKTRTVAFRIARLIAENKAKPYEILAVTFTNKAAGELRERINALVGQNPSIRPEYGEVQACTFHRFCVQILRRYGDLSGKFTRFFTIYDRNDGETIIKHLTKEKGWESDWTPGHYLNVFSNLKNEISDPEGLTESFPKNKYIKQVYDEYIARLRKANALDLDDLLCEAYKLLASQEQVRNYYQRLYQYIHVDEYQDTNKIQFLLLTILAGNRKNVYAVGDTDQAIYGWRGADIRNILEFEKDFYPAKTILLEQNYRSIPGILRSANKLIEHNKQRKPKVLWTQSAEGEKIRLLSSVDGREEATSALNWLDLTEAGGTAAVLYRTNAQSREFEEACVKRGLRYSIVGSLRFYERREVKDALAYFRLLAQVEQTTVTDLTQLTQTQAGSPDDLAFERAVQMPPRKVGKTSLDRLKELANQKNLSLFDASCSEAVKQEFSGRWAKGLDTFVSEIKLRQAQVQDSVPPEKVIRSWIENCGFIDHLRKEDEGEERVRNVQELLDSFDRFRSEFPESGINAFLENVTLVSDIDQVDLKSSVVALLTVHAAKGLEFDQVVVAGLEDGLFPLINDASAMQDLEEERRLCYVALTRARKRLALSSVSYRSRYGRTEWTKPSRFFDEIPLEELDGDLFGLRKTSAITGQPRLVSIKAVSAPVVPGKPSQTSSSGSGSVSYRPGQRVLHPSFGIGKIINCVPAEGGFKVVVDFKSVGAKTILTKFVALIPQE